MGTFNTLKQEIKTKYKKHNLNRPFIIAIDGLSGAGKTTLVQKLQNCIDQVVVIHIDDHIVKKEYRYNTGYEEWYEYYQLQWEVTSLKEQLFDKLLQNEQQLQLFFYNNEEDTLSENLINIPPNSIVIIEGIFLLREEWRAYYDYSVFVDCPKEVRYERVLNRDTYIGDLEERRKKYQSRYWIAEDYYLKTQKPLEYTHTIFVSEIENE